MSFKVVGVGEVLWDLLPEGPQLGGAPANFSYHAYALGARVQVITCIGNDDYGREIIRRFDDLGLPDDTVQVDPDRPTGTASVALSGNGIAHFTIQENVAWDFIAEPPEATAAVSAADAICFGSLAQRSKLSRNSIQHLITETPPTALRVFDVNLRQPFYTRSVVQESLHLANVVKLNDDELPVLARMFDLAGVVEKQVESLAETFSLGVVALTRGSSGSLLYQNSNRRWSDCASEPVRVIDTVGAGDSFTAALVMGLLHRMDLDEINHIANEVARYVCTWAGATPPMPEDFARKFSSTRPHN
jgi:fructokinase